MTASGGLPTGWSLEDARGARRDRARGWLWGPVAVAVLVRLALFLAGGLWGLDGADLRLDTIDYHVLGQSLASGEGFTYDASAPAARGHATGYEVEPLRTPGYPAVVAAVYAVVGARPGWVLLLQIVMEGATCALLALALRPSLGAVASGVAALVYALHPAASLYAVILLSEAVFVFLLVSAFGLLWGPWRQRPLARALGAGALLGAATLVKPLALWLPLVVGLALLATGRDAWRRSAREAALVLVGAAVLVAPWIARNAAVWGEPFLSTSTAYNALSLYAAPVQARATGTSDSEALAALAARAEENARASGVEPNSDLDRAPFWKAVAVETLREHPFLTLRLEAAGVVRSFVSIGRVSRLHVFGERAARAREPGARGALRWWWSEPLADRVLDVWALLYALVAYPLLAFGVVRAVRQRRGGPLAAGAALALFLLLATGIPGYSRFMVPAVPFWAGFVGLAVAGARALRAREQDRAAGVGEAAAGASPEAPFRLPFRPFDPSRWTS